MKGFIMFVYVDDSEDDELNDDYGYDYGCEEDYDYDPEKQSNDCEKGNGTYFLNKCHNK